MNPSEIRCSCGKTVLSKDEVRFVFEIGKLENWSRERLLREVNRLFQTRPSGCH